MVSKSTIANLFARSPFHALQTHMNHVRQCAEQVTVLFDALIASDHKGQAAAIEQIFALEEQADAVKYDLRAHLPNSLFMPVDRGDLLKILDLQDQIADTAQDIAGLLDVRAFDVPAGLDEPLAAFVRRCVDACIMCEKIINELDELLSVGFKGPGTEKVSEMIAELNKIESDTDNMGMDMTRRLFAMEGQISDISLMLWSRLFRDIGSLADNAEKVGNRLRLLIA